VVECAVVFPVLFILMAGMLIGGMGIFRYQQVAYLAREAARYASVHGGEYQQANAAAITAGTMPNVTEDYITTNIVKANAAGLDTSSLTVTVKFNMSSGSYGWDDTAHNGSRWPYSTKTVTTASGSTNYSETNTVSVTVSYDWTPELYITGPITLTSTAVMPMSY
jgi:Flp pilus assembly protein TadG